MPIFVYFTEQMLSFKLSSKNVIKINKNLFKEKQNRTNQVVFQKTLDRMPHYDTYNIVKIYCIYRYFTVQILLLH